MLFKLKKIIILLRGYHLKRAGLIPLHILLCFYFTCKLFYKVKKNYDRERIIQNLLKVFRISIALMVFSSVHNLILHCHSLKTSDLYN